ncbi:Clan CA, family C19, ubiquitin hydrolase-like cysteine peptidase [Trichomonas vaginalis G3]|uniref:Clan CA, family C19, ubiquitin hydrolase-like cysteine peptidase n=1 Tax=Trichomonas vaginalis (strain ATCC PRA-98 / G3) TaxID=412133 RepID=A2G0N3_TRIV3|nr:ubiquitinyl hydrolase protein [Trichomonas vaginalis G3]EAX89290.1 Clan CA, family C19, ubiquitin hydrolase-like cysteine peptidase [Trichomonas vaginalis G3]KAI5503202.1 ubiquitinyl hydrolase protein [Trichomonas vaginalis G3]|eukprot:XP_001302220.1 Clan CA, family C19, ubiquitin hydrolase-like cysteine peptidase [Trichomonas vaginalis G3]
MNEIPNISAWCDEILNLIDARKIESKHIKKISVYVSETKKNSKSSQPTDENTLYFINEFAPKLIEKISKYNIAPIENPPQFDQILIPLSKLFPSQLSRENQKYIDAMMIIFENCRIPFFMVRHYSFLGEIETNFKYYINCIEIFKSENFVQRVNQLCEATIDIYIANILLRIIQIMQRYHQIFEDIHIIEPLLPSFIASCQKLSISEIRSLNEQKFEQDFDIILNISSLSDSIQPLLSISVTINNIIFSSGIVSKQYAAISFINKELSDHPKYAESLCKILQEEKFISQNMTSLHHSLVDQFCKLMSKMVNYGCLDVKEILDFCQVAAKENQVVQSNYINSINKVVCRLKPLQLQEFLIRTAQSETEIGLMILIEQSRGAHSQTKKDVFDIFFDKFKKGDKRKIIIDIICRYAPTSAESVQRWCLNSLHESKDLDLALPLLQTTISSIDPYTAKEVFDTVVLTIDDKSILQFSQLMTKTLRAMSEINNEEFNSLLKLTKNSLINDETNSQIISDFMFLVVNRKISSGLIKHLMETISDFDEMSEKIFDLFKSSFEALNPKLMDFKYNRNPYITISELNSIDLVWKSLFKTGGKSLAKYIYKFCMKNEENMEFFIQKVIENINENGALETLAYVTKKNTSFLSKTAKFIPESYFVNVTFNGLLNESFRIPKNSSARDIKKFLKEKLKTAQISLKYNNESLDDNFIVKSNITINISGYFGTLKSEINPLPKIALFYDKILQKLKEEKTSKPALTVLLNLDLPKSFDFDTSFVNENYFVYLLNLSAISNAFCIKNMVDIVFDNTMTEENMQFALEVILHCAKNNKIEFIQNSLEKIVERCLSNEDGHKNLYLSIIKIYLDHGFKVTTEQVWKLTILAIFDENVEVRMTISDLLNLIPDKINYLSKLLVKSDNEYCTEYFEVLISVCRENVEELYKTSETLLFEKYSLNREEKFFEQLKFKPPAAEFTKSFFWLFEILVKTKEPQNLEEIANFIVSEIVFNGVTYYEPNSHIFNILIMSIGKNPEIGSNILKFLSTSNKILRGPTPVPVDKTGFRGLKNLGATCYMNSTLQQLCQIDEFVDLILSKKFEEKSWQAEFQYLICKMKYFPEKVINPFYFFNLWTDWGGEKVSASVQQDASEFLSLLFSRLEDIPGTLELFRGVSTSKFVTMEEEFVAERDETFETLNFDVNNHANIQESIRTYLQPSLFTGKDKYMSDQGKIDAKCYHFIKEQPTYLIVQLKRFEYNVEKMTREKINSRYEFSDFLDIGPMTITKQNSIYDLIGIQVHMGTTESGHYFSYVKKDNKWYSLNDEIVKEFEGDVFEETAGGISSFEFFDERTQSYRKGSIPKSSNAYILWYKKYDAVLKIKKEFNEVLFEKLRRDMNSSLVRGVSQSIEFCELAKTAARYDTDGGFLINYTLNLIEAGKDSQDLPFICMNLLNIQSVADKVMDMDPLILVNINAQSRQFMIKIFEKAALISREKEKMRHKIILILQNPNTILSNSSIFSEFFYLVRKLLNPELQKTVDKFLENDLPNYASNTKKFYELSDLSNVIPLMKTMPPVDTLFKIMCNYKNIQSLIGFLPAIQAMENINLSSYDMQSLTGLFILYQLDSDDRHGLYNQLIKVLKEKNKLFAQKLLAALNLINIDISPTFDSMTLIELLLVNNSSQTRDLGRQIILKIYDLKKGEESIVKLLTSFVETIGKCVKQSKGERLMGTISKEGEVEESAPDFFSIFSKIVLDSNMVNFLIPISSIIVESVYLLRDAPQYPNRSQLAGIQLLHDTIYPLMIDRFFSDASYSKLISSLSCFNTFNRDVKTWLKMVLDLTPTSEIKTLYKSNLFQEVCARFLTKDAAEFIISHPTNLNIISSILFDQNRYEAYIKANIKSFNQVVNYLLTFDVSSCDIFENYGTYQRAWQLLLKETEQNRVSVMNHLANFNKTYLKAHNGETKFIIGFLNERLIAKYNDVGFSINSLFSLYSDKDTFEYLESWYFLAESFLYSDQNQMDIFERLVSHHTPICNCPAAASLIVTFCTLQQSQEYSLAILTQELSRVKDHDILDILVNYANRTMFWNTDKGLNVLGNILSSVFPSKIIMSAYYMMKESLTMLQLSNFRENMIRYVLSSLDEDFIAETVLEINKIPVETTKSEEIEIRGKAAQLEKNGMQSASSIILSIIKS